MNKSIFVGLFLILTVPAWATSTQLQVLENVDAFYAAIENAQVPVLVQFSAAWCHPCQELKKTFTEVAPEYTTDQILIYYVDADVNASLRMYLKGGYPTVRIFREGNLVPDPYILGSKPASYVRDFINTVIGRPARRSPCELKILDDVAAFEQLVANSTVPVVVQFSAYWCNPCQALKATMEQIAPSYDDNEIVIAYVDAYVNSTLKKYLKGGYPTCRIFINGQLVETPYILGNKPEAQMRAFLDQAKDMPNSPIMSPLSLEKTK